MAETQAANPMRRYRWKEEGVGPDFMAARYDGGFELDWLLDDERVSAGEGGAARIEVPVRDGPFTAGYHVVVPVGWWLCRGRGGALASYNDDTFRWAAELVEPDRTIERLNRFHEAAKMVAVNGSAYCGHLQTNPNAPDYLEERTMSTRVAVPERLWTELHEAWLDLADNEGDG